MFIMKTLEFVRVNFGNAVPQRMATPTDIAESKNDSVECGG